MNCGYLGMFLLPCDSKRSNLTGELRCHYSHKDSEDRSLLREKCVVNVLLGLSRTENAFHLPGLTANAYENTVGHNEQILCH